MSLLLNHTTATNWAIGNEALLLSTDSIDIELEDLLSRTHDPQCETLRKIQRDVLQ